MVAKLKKGGNARFVFDDFALLDSCTIPANFKIDEIVVRKSGTTAGNLRIGTTVVAPVLAVAEIQTLTITAEPTAAGNLTVVLDGATGVVTAIVDADLMPGVATKIAANTYPGWTAQAIGSTVRFTSNTVGARVGAFTFNGAATAVTGSFVETRVGVTAVPTTTGQEIVANVALSLTDGTITYPTIVAKQFAVDTVVYIGVDSVATGDIAIHVRKMY